MAPATHVAASATADHVPAVGAMDDDVAAGVGAAPVDVGADDDASASLTLPSPHPRSLAHVAALRELSDWRHATKIAGCCSAFLARSTGGGDPATARPLAMPALFRNARVTDAEWEKMVGLLGEDYFLAAAAPLPAGGVAAAAPSVPSTPGAQGAHEGQDVDSLERAEGASSRPPSSRAAAAIADCVRQFVARLRPAAPAEVAETRVRVRVCGRVVRDKELFVQWRARPSSANSSPAAAPCCSGCDVSDSPRVDRTPAVPPALRPDDLTIAAADAGPPLESGGRAGSVVGPELAGRPERAADPPPRPADSTADAISLRSLRPIRPPPQNLKPFLHRHRTAILRH